MSLGMGEAKEKVRAMLIQVSGCCLIIIIIIIIISIIN
jgi:hypothetical protein